MFTVLARIWETSCSPRRGLVFSSGAKETAGSSCPDEETNQRHVRWKQERCSGPWNLFQVVYFQDFSVFGHLMSLNRQHRVGSGSAHGQPLFSHHQPQCTVPSITSDCPLSSILSTSPVGFHHPGRHSWDHHTPALWPNPTLGSYLLTIGLSLCVSPISLISYYLPSTWVLAFFTSNLLNGSIF